MRESRLQTFLLLTTSFSLLVGACNDTDDEAFGVLEAPARAQALPALEAVPSDGELIPSDQAPSFVAYYKVLTDGCAYASGVQDSFGGHTLQFPDTAEFALAPGEREATKVCNIQIEMSSYRDYAYTVLSFSHSGHGRLAERTRAVVTTALTVQNRGRSLATTRMTGPYDADFREETVVPAVGRVWSSCGGELRVRVSQSVALMRDESTTSSDATAHVVLPSAQDGSPYTVKLGFRRCPREQGDGGI